MDENLKLLVLKEEEPSKDRRMAFRAARTRALNVIRSAGAKVRHDSGGRLIVIQTSEEAEKILAERLAGARLVALESDLSQALADLEETESLFLEALRIRTSKSYRESKKRRKVGETPEEKELVSGPDVREEY